MPSRTTRLLKPLNFLTPTITANASGVFYNFGRRPTVTRELRGVFAGWELASPQGGVQRLGALVERRLRVQDYNEQAVETILEIVVSSSLPLNDNREPRRSLTRGASAVIFASET